MCLHLDRNEQNIARRPQSRLHGTHILAWISERSAAGTNVIQMKWRKMYLLKGKWFEKGTSEWKFKLHIKMTWGKEEIIEMFPLRFTGMLKGTRCMNRLFHGLWTSGQRTLGKLLNSQLPVCIFHKVKTNSTPQAFERRIVEPLFYTSKISLTVTLFYPHNIMLSFIYSTVPLLKGLLKIVYNYLFVSSIQLKLYDSDRRLLVDYRYKWFIFSFY